MNESDLRPEVVSLIAYGKPVPKGSMRMVPTRRGRQLVANSPKLARWERSVRGAALIAVGPGRSPALVARPVAVELIFGLPRSKARRDALFPDLKRDDLDKLVRAVLDALTGLVYDDDGRVVEIIARKFYAGAARPLGVEVTVWPLDDEARRNRGREEKADDDPRDGAKDDQGRQRRRRGVRSNEVRASGDPQKRARAQDPALRADEGIGA